MTSACPPIFSPAPNLHHQGALHHLLHLGHLRALQHTLQDHCHTAGVLQPAHRHGSPQAPVPSPPTPQLLPVPPCIPVHVPQQFKNRQRCECKNFQAPGWVARAPRVATQVLPRSGQSQTQPASCWEGGGMREGSPRSRHPKTQPGALRGLSPSDNTHSLLLPFLIQAHVTQPPRSELQLWALGYQSGVQESGSWSCLPGLEGRGGLGPAGRAGLPSGPPHHLPPESGGARTWAWAERPCNWPWWADWLGHEPEGQRGCVRSGLVAWGRAGGSL